MRKTYPELFPALLVCYELIVYLSNDMYLPALPEIVSDLGTTQHLAQYTLTAWFAGATSFQLILGPLSDRYGRRPILIPALAVFIISTGVCALAPDIGVLLAGRYFQGSSACAIGVAGYAAIHELYDTQKAIRITAAMNSVSILAASFGPALGGLVLLFSDWRFTFWLLTILALINIISLIYYMPESNPAEKRVKFNGRLLLTNYRKVLRNSAFLKNTLTYCFIMSSTIVWLAMGPFLVIDAFQYTPLSFGVFQILIFGCFVFGSRVVCSRVEKMPSKKLIDIGLLLIIVAAVIALVCSLLFPNLILTTIFAMMVYETGAGLAMSPLQRAAVDACSQPMGVKMAVFSTLLSSFCVLSSLLVGVFYNEELLTFAAIVTVLTLFAAGCFFSHELKRVFRLTKI
jgi:DHA1 family multidrug/chloramphenicol efflux transport protein-like MFS transporter